MKVALSITSHAIVVVPTHPRPNAIYQIVLPIATIQTVGTAQSSELTTVPGKSTRNELPEVRIVVSSGIKVRKLATRS